MRSREQLNLNIPEFSVNFLCYTNQTETTNTPQIHDRSHVSKLFTDAGTSFGTDQRTQEFLKNSKTFFKEKSDPSNTGAMMAKLKELVQQTPNGSGILIICSSDEECVALKTALEEELPKDEPRNKIFSSIKDVRKTEKSTKTKKKQKAQRLSVMNPLPIFILHQKVASPDLIYKTGPLKV